MEDFERVLYEATLVAFGKILSKYNVFAQSSILRDVGREIVSYLNSHGFGFDEKGDLDDLSTLTQLFVKNGFAEKLDIEPADKGANYIWHNLYGVDAYEELHRIADNPFLSCPLNLCLFYIADKQNKTMRLHRKSFDRVGKKVESQYEIVEKEGKHGEGFDALVIENARLYDLAQERATSLEKAQEEIKVSEERFRAIIENANDPIFIKNKDLSYQITNPAMARLLDLPIDRIVGRSDADLFGVDIAAATGKADQAVLSGGMFEGEFFYPVKGVPRCFHLIMVPLRTSGDGIVGLCGIARDITERKRTEEELTKYKDHLLKLVEKRTEELTKMNLDLRKEVEERRESEKALHSKTAFLEAQANSTIEGILVMDSEGWAVLLNQRIMEMCAIPRQMPDPKGEDLLSGHIAPLTTRPQIFRKKVRRLCDQVYEISRDEIEFKNGMIVDMYSAPVLGQDGQYYGRIWTFRDITERKHAEAALHHTMEQLRTLSHRLLEIQETERRYIARELHDEVGQALTALRIGLKRTEGSKTLESALASIQESTPTVEELINKVRNLSIELRPSILDDFGLAAALDWYVNWFSAKVGFEAVFRTDLTEERFPPILELTCFRIAQEALTNAARHSSAKTVHLDLETMKGELHLTVKDDGKGFNIDETRLRAQKGESFGLLGMQERASLAGGSLELTSNPGKGTVIHVYFPVEPGDGGPVKGVTDKG